ncbi:hypothetical protein DL770_002644 [Monosporascus sp. CRB-9-2]|nr:hypothetical protein DL770_002644 [Monosporascus sp. CRB-9-2]
MTTIRPRRDSDLAGCVATLRMVHSLGGYPVDGVEDALGFLRTDDRAWVAARDADGAIVGHAALSKPDERSGYVALWRQLHPTGFGSGSDKGDIVGLGAPARRRGAKAVMLALLKDQDAIRLYRKLGWMHYGTTAYRWGDGKQMDGECFVSPEPNNQNERNSVSVLRAA